MPYKDPAKTAEAKLRYSRKHRTWLNEKNVSRDRVLKMAAICQYGGKCACCGESHYKFLSFDHINGGGAEDRKSGLKGGTWYKHLLDNYRPDLYQLLCFNCHMAKDYHGGCPHKEES